MGACLAIALRNLLQARRRTLLLGTALAAVTLLLQLLLGLASGLDETMLKNATVLKSGHVNVAGLWKTKTTDAWTVLNGVHEVRRLVEENTPGLAFTVRRDRFLAKAVSSHQSLYVAPSGLDFSEESHFLRVIQLARESEYKKGGRDAIVADLQRLKQPRSILIFASQARRLAVEIGDPLTLMVTTPSGRSNTIDVTVAAVARDMGVLSKMYVFLPIQDTHELLQLKPEASSEIMVYLQDPDRSVEVMEHLRAVLKGKGYRVMDHEPVPYYWRLGTAAGEDWTGQKLDLNTWRDEVSYMDFFRTMMNVISAILVGILLAIISVGIMNSMWISVRERTSEVGTMRAIGMSRGQILWMFLLEAVVLGAVSTALGGVLGALLALGLNAAAIPIPYDAYQVIFMTDILHLAVSPWHALGAMVGFTIITGSSAIWPAMRAASLQPVKAIARNG